MSNFSGFIESKEDADKQNGAVAMKMPISRLGLFAMKMPISRLGLFAMKMPISRLGLFAKKMPAASDNGSQPYRNAVRCFEPTVTVREARESKWLVWDCPLNNISLPLW